MPSFGNPNTANITGENLTQRWQKILNLSPDVFMKDISTGKRYQVCDFKPLHSDRYQNQVTDFECQRTGDRVCVNFLRLLEDGSRCSIGGSTR